MGKISFSNVDVTFKLGGKRNLGAFINKLFHLEGKLCSSIDYLLCTDNYLIELNNNFLHHDFYTDVITFDLSTPGSEIVVAEIYISIERVKDNALRYETSFELELHRVIFHGVLHLCGYKDKKKSEITKMRQKEGYYLRLFEETKNQ